MLKRICVFCGSNTGARAAYVEAAENLGKLLAKRGIGLVYGGGKVGLMGKIADSVMASGGEVIGVIPQSLMRKEIAHAGLTDLRVVDSMHQRKALMAELSDGFIALPGGFGTFEEICEIVTWAQLGLHAKPCGILNVEGYYDHLLGLFDHAVAEKFLRPENRALVIASKSPTEMLNHLTNYKVPHVEKWITPETV
ncbi:MAG TPA: TIGR00730 family Rossman fold protein [Terriglobales bacterium]|nr:TIGR00730 family Rossman fold protein [Terriglobales bacterium]